MTTSPRSILMAVILFCYYLFYNPLRAEVHDGFETPDPSWRLSHWEGNSGINRHFRDFRVSHDGQCSEFVQVTTQGGSFAYLAYDTPQPMMLIDELTIRVWVQADCSGLVLAARVVLPNARDPRTGRPLTVTLTGSRYDVAGGWQELVLRNLRRQFESKRPALLDRYGANVDFRQPVVDRILLNVHGGKSQTSVWIDDLDIVGDVPPENTGLQFDAIVSQTRETRQSNERHPKASIAGSNAGQALQSRNESRIEANPQRAPSPAQVSGSQFLVHDRPFFPLIARWHGEPMTALKELGFNTVWLDALPPEHVVNEAERLNMYLLVPFDGRLDDRLFHSRTIAWYVDVESAAEVEPLRQLALDTRRPLLLPPPASSEARIDDLLVQPANWQGQPLTRSGNPVWFELRMTPGRPYEACRQVFEALMSGARGIVLDCKIPPASVGDAFRDRLVVQKLMKDLSIIEPWIAGSNGCERVADNGSRWHRALFPTARSHLVIATRPADSTASAKLEIVDPGAASSFEAYQLTESRMQPLRRQRVAGGVKVEIADPDDVNLIVFTQDPLTVNYIGRRLADRVGSGPTPSRRR